MWGLASGGRNVTDSDFAGFRFPLENFVSRDTIVCVRVCIHTLTICTSHVYVHICIYVCMYLYYVCIHYIHSMCIHI